MAEITLYSKDPQHNNTQDDLQRLAKHIFSYGKIESVYHFKYGTNNPEQLKYSNNEFVNVFVNVEDGGVCYIVVCEGFPVKFFIHMRGFEVTSITEEIER